MVNDDALRRVDALLQVGLRLARSVPSGQILLARIADAIDLEWIPRPWGEELAAQEEFARAVDDLGWLPAGRAASALEVIDLALGDLAGPGAVRLDGDAVRAARERLIAQPEATVELILHGALPPQDLWPARGVAQLFGTIARVGAAGDWRALIGDALHDGWT